MNTVVLMAGDATRFLNSKYNDIKPLIKVKGKEIIKRTTDSLLGLEDRSEMFFAARADQNEKFNIEQRVRQIYKKPNFIWFNCLTRGNLETAYFSVKTIEQKDDPLLILDSDNQYDGSRFFDFIEAVKDEAVEFATICYFDPLDDSNKWCFALPDGLRVICLDEKNSDALNNGGKPMVGTFYFSSAKLFLQAAEYILGLGVMSKNEFYMSQSIIYLLNAGFPVFGCKISDVIPLGTPIDVERAENA